MHFPIKENNDLFKNSWETMANKSETTKHNDQIGISSIDKVKTKKQLDTSFKDKSINYFMNNELKVHNSLISRPCS